MTAQLGMLRNVYTDFSQAEADAELARVIEETAIERHWIAEAGLEPYQTLDDMLAAAEAGDLVEVTSGLGYATIQRLTHWEPARDDPEHEFHYSPNLLRPKALGVFTSLTAEWQDTVGVGMELAVTSLGRHAEYQRRIASGANKIAMPEEIGPSSHLIAYALDVDGCGINFIGEDGSRRPVNPRTPGYDDHRELVEDRLFAFEQVLVGAQARGEINFVRELPGTEQNCFHICVNPLVTPVS